MNKQNAIVLSTVGVASLIIYKTLKNVFAPKQEAATSVQQQDSTSSLPKIGKGHVGLINEGATCYLNSLLQTLYHLPTFRKAVFKTKSTNKMVVALKQVFYEMMVV